MALSAGQPRAMREPPPMGRPTCGLPERVEQGRLHHEAGHDPPPFAHREPKNPSGLRRRPQSHGSQPNSTQRPVHVSGGPQREVAVNKADTPSQRRLTFAVSDCRHSGVVLRFPAPSSRNCSHRRVDGARRLPGKPTGDARHSHQTSCTGTDGSGGAAGCDSRRQPLDGPAHGRGSCSDRSLRSCAPEHRPPGKGGRCCTACRLVVATHCRRARERARTAASAAAHRAPGVPRSSQAVSRPSCRDQCDQRTPPWRTTTPGRGECGRAQ